METRLTNTDGTLPTDEQAQWAGQNAWAAVEQSTRALRVAGTVSTVPGAPTTSATFTTGTKTVAATGTPEALGTGSYREVFIYPLRSNTAVVYWGTSSTNNAQDGTLPVVLAPTGLLVNLAHIFIGVTVNGEGVRYVAVS